MVQHPNPAGAAGRAGRRRSASSRRRRAPQGLPNEQVIAGALHPVHAARRIGRQHALGRLGRVGQPEPAGAVPQRDLGRREGLPADVASWPRTSPRNRNLLELLYVVLSFGFEGRYRVARQRQGAARQRARAAVADAARSSAARGRHGAVAALGRACRAQAARLRRRHPDVGGGVAAGAAAAASSTSALRCSLNGALRRRVRRRCAALDVKAAAGRRAAAAAPPPAPPRLADLLKPDIDAGLVRCATWPTARSWSSRGDGFFEPGSAVVADRVRPLLDAHRRRRCSQMPGTVLVTGHTDNQPIRSLRFPSNWHLSQDRADARARRCSPPTVKPERMRAEGRADAEPVGRQRHAGRPRAATGASRSPCSSAQLS